MIQVPVSEQNRLEVNVEFSQDRRKQVRSTLARVNNRSGGLAGVNQEHGVGFPLANAQTDEQTPISHAEPPFPLDDAATAVAKVQP